MESRKQKQKTLTSFFSRSNISMSEDGEPGEYENPSTSVPTLSEGKATENFTLSVLKNDECLQNNGAKGFSDSLQSSSNSDSCCNEMNLQSRWPSVWTEEIWNHKRYAFPRIDCKNEKLGYKLCSEVSCLRAFEKERIAISKKWHSYNVTYNGSSRATQLTSLRKKIFEHKQSTAHTTAEKIIAKGQTQTLENINYIAKNDKPYSDNFGLLELQQLNGLDIGVGLHSRYSAVEIIGHISKEMKNFRSLRKIVGHYWRIPKLRCYIYFDCLSEFEHLLNCLNKHGFHDDYLKENLVAFASDGVSEMLRENSGAAKKLVTKYTNFVL
ncbi:hypothetical protein PR048_020326 [Dryococelus australis]|uniref:Uncharacterized protein n=1 Tax=Dryococelus australis TaxID=614101 RepID=A0ABQ9H625_9NEOP|nr:hypothetical protein PR048_020326 [Dryococelus australis]